MIGGLRNTHPAVHWMRRGLGLPTQNEYQDWPEQHVRIVSTEMDHPPALEPVHSSASNYGKALTQVTAGLGYKCDLCAQEDRVSGPGGCLSVVATRHTLMGLPGSASLLKKSA